MAGQNPDLSLFAVDDTTKITNVIGTSVPCFDR